MGTHSRVFSESYPMNTYMRGLNSFKTVGVRVLWTKVASALEGLNMFGLRTIIT